MYICVYVCMYEDLQYREFSKPLLYIGFVKHLSICREKDKNIYICVCWCVQSPCCIGALQNALSVWALQTTSLQGP